MDFYAMEADTDEEGRIINFRYKKDHRGRSWIEGVRFDPNAERVFLKPPPTPVVIYLDSKKSHYPMPTFDKTPLPLLRKDLLEVLLRCGVKNMDVYPVEIRDENENKISEEYYAFNLIGLVDGVDFEKSKIDQDQMSKNIDMQIDSLRINPKAVQGFHMFRLSQNLSSIIVDESIKKAVELAKIPMVRFFLTQDVAIL